MLDNAQRILDNYIEVTAKRKTPERYAVLKAIYGMDGHFTVEELNEALEKKKFIVSRATLYNTLRLLLKVNLVVRHKLVDKTKYEATLRTMCGKVIEVELPDVESAITSSRLYRFRKEGFSLYIYGICSSCQSKLTRKRTMISKNKTDNK